MAKVKAEPKAKPQPVRFYSQPFFYIVVGFLMITSGVIYGMAHYAEPQTAVAASTASSDTIINLHSAGVALKASQITDADKLAHSVAELAGKVAKPVEPLKSAKNGWQVGQVGQRLLKEQARVMLAEAIKQGKTDVNLPVEFYRPTYVNERDLTMPENLPESLTLTLDDQKFAVGQDVLQGWFSVSYTAPSSLTAVRTPKLLAGRTETNVGLDQSKVRGYLDVIAPQVHRAPVDAVLTIVGGRATAFRQSIVGRDLDYDQIYSDINGAAKSGTGVIKLAIVTTQPAVTEEGANNLGIKELVATGWSDFRGSSPARVTNIRVGASKFQGVLIKPGDTFSFAQHLGEVDAANGFVEGLVIIKNATAPGFGGGICQVSSTVFRAALNAGLPITERVKHAYPVIYYNPPGVDATIYTPHPDLRFVNDTGSHILMQSEIKGTKLYFHFFGTKPSRTVKFSGNDNGGSAADIESTKTAVFNNGTRGNGSFDALFYRFIYDSSGKLIDKANWLSKYDSPDKYPKTT